MWQRHLATPEVCSIGALAEGKPLCAVPAGGEGTLADIQDARGPLADAAKAAAGRGDAPDSSGAGPPAAYDYLLSCAHNAGGGRLLLAAGDSGGGVAVFPVREPSGGEAAGFDPPVAWMGGAHTEVGQKLESFCGIAWPLYCMAMCVDSSWHVSPAVCC